jgi:hypothetical protein
LSLIDPETARPQPPRAAAARAPRDPARSTAIVPRQPAGAGFIAELRRAAPALWIAVGLVLLLQPLFVLALTAAHGDARLDHIKSEVRDAFAAGVLADNNRPANWIDRGGHQFTECVALNLALDPQPEALAAALQPSLQFRMGSACSELHRFVAGEPVDGSMSYSRYWHGYRVYLWPLLSRLTLHELRLVNVLLILATTVIFALGLRAAIGPAPAAVLLVAVIGLTDLWRIYVITTHALSMALILAGSGVFAWLYGRRPNAGLALMTAAMLGALFNFIDFLINPPVMPMLLAFIVMAAAPPRPVWQVAGGRPAGLTLAILTAASWFGGYALTWGAKWFLAVALADDPMATAAGILGQIGFRLYGLEEGSRIFRVPLVPSIEMIGTALIAYGLPLVAAVAALVAAHVRAHRENFDRARFLALAAPVAIAFIWFELLSNHTQAHPHFVYRSAATAIGILLAAALLATPVALTRKRAAQHLRAMLRWAPGGPAPEQPS